MQFNATNCKNSKASLMMLMFVALAFTMKAVFPSGFMPATDKTGVTQIVICSGMGEKTITVPSDDAPAKKHKNAAPEKLCTYQILASAKSLLSSSAYIVPAPEILHTDFTAQNDQTPVTTSVLSFDARGPPLV